jgi:hypothetical protein
MSHSVLRSLTVGLALASAACSESTPPGQSEAELKLVHVSASVGAADVFVGGERVIADQAFGTSRLVRVPAGNQQLSIRKNGQSLRTLGVLLSASHVNSVVLSDSGLQASSVVTPDTGQAISNRANIRLINITSGNAAAPTLLHVLINAPGVSPDSVARLGIDTQIASHGTLMYFDPGHFRFRFVPQGTTTVLTEVEFDVAAGEKKAVVLQRENGVYRAEVVTEP